MRVGIGYDVHRLCEGRKLIIGGVAIEYELGLLGHSDADVLCHAIGDALLGAANLGDLGKHFPPDDPAYEGISSLVLLERIAEMLKERNLKIVYIDSVVVCEHPRLAVHIPKMKENIARSLGISIEQVSLKATTSEGLGFAGRGEGISAQAIALVEEKYPIQEND